jgi:hypothetical protein
VRTKEEEMPRYLWKYFQGVFAWKSFESRFPPPNKAPTKQNISLGLVLGGIVSKAALIISTNHLVPLLVVWFHPNQLSFLFSLFSANVN